MIRIIVPALLMQTLVCHGLQAQLASKKPDAASWAEENMESLSELYRHFHAHPELSFQEKESSRRLADEWESVGYRVTRHVGGHGVVAVMANGDGPTVMLRCDMDALPVREMTQLVYASQATAKNEEGTEVNVMHACGHDIHMTSMVGVARYLAARQDHWQGKLIIIGQPAEERGAGAKAMLDDGLFERFGKPDFALALHVNPVLPTGHINYRAGYAMANVDSVDITVKGKGGHGAYPHATVDPIVQAAELVLSLQTIVSREIDPVAPAVITVGSIHGGTKHNVIGAECHLQLTVRSYAPDVRKQLLAAIRRKALAVATGARAPEPTVKVSEGTPSLFNDKQLVERLAPVFESVLGEENVHLTEPVMGGEDFSRYGLAGVPIVMFGLGSVDAKRLQRFQQIGQVPPSLHSPLYYPDYEQTLITGITATASAALELLRKDE